VGAAKSITKAGAPKDPGTDDSLRTPFAAFNVANALGVAPEELVTCD
jgi:hypothetical protein